METFATLGDLPPVVEPTAGELRQAAVTLAANAQRDGWVDALPDVLASLGLDMEAVA
jgi:hypothetical protein